MELLGDTSKMTRLPVADPQDVRAREVYGGSVADPAAADVISGTVSEVERTSGSKGITPAKIKKVWDHPMVEEQLLTYDGKSTARRYDPSAQIADA